MESAKGVLSVRPLFQLPPYFSGGYLRALVVSGDSEALIQDRNRRAQASTPRDLPSLFSVAVRELYLNDKIMNIYIYIKNIVSMETSFKFLSSNPVLDIIWPC